MAGGAAPEITMPFLDQWREPTSNRVELVGYVGHTPERRYTPDAEPVVQFALATHRWQENEGGPVQFTDWHTVVAHNDLMEMCLRLRVGSLVRVAGWLQTGAGNGRAGSRTKRAQVVLTSLALVRAAPVQPRLPVAS